PDIVMSPLCEGNASADQHQQHGGVVDRIGEGLWADTSYRHEDANAGAYQRENLGDPAGHERSSRHRPCGGEAERQSNGNDRLRDSRAVVSVTIDQPATMNQRRYEKGNGLRAEEAAYDR